MSDLEKRAKEYARKEVYYGAYVDDEAGREIAEEVYVEATERETKLLSEQLTRAKEIIKKFSEFVNNETEYNPEYSQEQTDLWNELCEQAEQFLSEVEK